MLESLLLTEFVFCLLLKKKLVCGSEVSIYILRLFQAGEEGSTRQSCRRENICI